MTEFDIAKEEERLKKTLDSFSFDSIQSPPCSFFKKTGTELFGQDFPSEYLNEHLEVFKSFLLSCALEIKKNPDQYIIGRTELIENKEVECYRAPKNLGSNLREFWHMAVLYTQKYYELCDYLVGGIIDVPTLESVPVSIEYSQQLWREYSYDILELDQYIIRVDQDRFRQICIFIFENVNTSLLPTVEHRKGYYTALIDQILDYMRIEECYSDNQPMISSGIVKLFRDEIESKLPKSYLVQKLREKYCLSPNIARQYVEEYKNFLVMAMFAKKVLSPSDPVDQVWHVHQFDTRNYREFCLSAFDQLIFHSPSQEGNPEEMREPYQYSLCLYEKLFGISPPEHIWPPMEKHIASLYSFERLVSLYRLIDIVVVICQTEPEIFCNFRAILDYMPKLYSEWRGASTLSTIFKNEIINMSN